MQRASFKTNVIVSVLVWSSSPNQCLIFSMTSSFSLSLLTTRQLLTPPPPHLFSPPPRWPSQPPAAHGRGWRHVSGASQVQGSPKKQRIIELFLDQGSSVTRYLCILVPAKMCISPFSALNQLVIAVGSSANNYIKNFPKKCVISRSI